MFLNIGKLFSAAVIAQGIQLLALPLISRLYDPIDFANYAQVNSIVTFFVVFATLQMHHAIVMESSDNTEVIQIGNSGILIFSLLAFFVILFFPFGSEMKDYSLAYAVFISLLITFISLSNILKGHLNSIQKYNVVSTFLVVRSMLCIIFQGLFSLESEVNGLIVGLLFSEVICFLLFYKNSRYLSLNTKETFGFKFFLEKVKKRKQFTIYGTLQESISVASFTLPLVMMPIIFNDSAAGQFAMAHRILWAATVAISMAISQVCLYRYAKIEHVNILKCIFSDFKVPIFLIVILSILIYPLIPEIILFTLGEKWMLASDMSTDILIWCVFFIISVPFRVIYKILEIQKVQLCFELVFMFILFSLFYFSEMNILEVITYLSVIGVIQNLTLILYILFRLRIEREYNV